MMIGVASAADARQDLGQQSKNSIWRTKLLAKWIWRAMLLAPLLLTACQSDKDEASAPAPAAEVDIAAPLKKEITEWEDFTGRFEAVRRVDVRARVTGYLLEKKFQDGQIVKQGDVLYVIDPRSFEFEVQRTQAQFDAAKRSYERAKSLRERQVVSEEDYDRRLQEMQSAEAALNVAKLNLGFTKVTAPSSGKISNDFTDVGNLVRENDTVLTRIVSVDPIHFVFEASQGSLLKYLRLDRAGQRPSSDRAPNPIVIKLLDEEGYAHKGRMNFVDNIIDPGTGTIRGRALVENKRALIYPGLFGRARLMGRSNFEATLLPEKSINTDQNRKFVYVVNSDNKTERRYVTTGSMLENGLVIIEAGLQGNERVVVNGIQRIRSAEQEVTPVKTDITWTEIQGMPDTTSFPSLAEIQGEGDIKPATFRDSRAEQGAGR